MEESMLTREEKFSGFFQTLDDSFQTLDDSKKFFESGYRDFPNLTNGSPNASMSILYARKSWFELWKVLESLEANKKSSPREWFKTEPGTEETSRLWLQGLPGCGKSSLVWHWCLVYCSKIENHGKTLCWLQVIPGDCFLSVVISGGKITQTFTSSPNFSFLNPDVIVLDGITKDSEFTKTIWKNWLNAVAYPSSVIIIISSDQIAIPDIQAAQHDLRVERSYSWELNEYREACKNTQFLNQVLPNLLPQNEEQSVYDIDDPAVVESLLLEKFRYAGSSARFMFNYNISQIENELLFAIARCPTSKEQGSLGAPDVKNTLQTEYPGDISFQSKWSLVSEFAVRLCAKSSEKIYHLILDNELLFNPVLKGVYQFLHLMFKPPMNATEIKLKGNPIKFKENENHEKSEYSISLSLADRYVVEFEHPILIEKFSIFQESQHSTGWFIPTKFNDIIIIDKAEYNTNSVTANPNFATTNHNYNNNREPTKRGLIRMIEISIAQTHSMNLKHVKKFISALSSDQLGIQKLNVNDYDLSVSVVVPTQIKMNEFSLVSPDLGGIDSLFPTWRTRAFVYGNMADVQLT